MRDEQLEETIAVDDLDGRSKKLAQDAGTGQLRPVVVEADDERIAEVRRIGRPGGADIWTDYDPAAARESWWRSAGVLRGVDVEALLAEIKAERE